MDSHNKKQPSGTIAVLGMGSCYALGTFTDNFYKQAAILLAAATQMGSMQSIATILFSLPFILFSAWAGWLADRLPKKYIVIGAKSLELTALLCGGFMLVNGYWAGILCVIFVMGTQATIFSPAINGSIPENFPPQQVPRVNSLIKLASTAAILAGMALAGVFLDMRPQSMGGGIPNGLIPQYLLTASGAAPEDGAAYGRGIAGLFIIVIAVLGVLTSFILRTIPPANAASSPAFPWTGPADSFRHMLECRKDGELFTVLMAEAFFYGIAAIAVISIANMAATLSYSNTTAGLMTAVLMVGIAVGSLIAGKQRAESWRRLLQPAAMGMAAMLTLTALSPLLPSGEGISPQLCWIFSTLFLCGLCGGLYLIPLSSFIQIRPAAAEKGKVVAVSNFMSFMAMALFGAAFQIISLLPPNLTFALYAFCVVLFIGVFARPRLAAMPGSSLRDAASNPLGVFLKAVLALRYKVNAHGLEDIPLAGQSTGSDSANSSPARSGILFLPNHPALIDPLLVYSRIAGLTPRPLSDERQLSGPVQAFAGRVIKAVTIPDLEKDGRKGRDGVRQGLQMVIDALQNGDNILLYPSGRVYRSAEESLGGNSGVYKILSAIPDLRVVLVRTTGLWGSSFSYAGGNSPKLMRALLRGLGTVIVNLLFFTPKRVVEMEFEEARNLPRTQGKRQLNACLDAFYSKATRPAEAVPRFFWQGSRPIPMPEITAKEQNTDVSAVPDAIFERVSEIVREQAECDAAFPIKPELRLRNDLHLDSLSLMDLASALEKEFGCALPNLEGLETVGDCLAAAAGLLQVEAEEKPMPAPQVWFDAEKKPDAAEVLTVLHGKAMQAENVPAAFLQLARTAPGRVLTADRSGLRTRRQMLTGALALSRRFADLPGKRLGIMLPAAPAALAVWLAALLAGKEPVLLNWTLGARNIQHCITSSGIRHAVTATALLDQLERTDVPVSDFPVEFIAADKLAATLSFSEKLGAALRAFAHCSALPWSIKTDNIPETAAILFTSGSEAAPKAVPLSHENIMTNAADVAAVLRVKKSDRLLAMLPPFHSFGLLTGLTLPAISGLAAAYHPNPTESVRLVSLVRDYRLSLMGATPTFLDAMLSRAAETEANATSYRNGDKIDTSAENHMKDKANGNPLSSLRYVFVGAEKCPDHVYRAFASACPDAVLCEGYGITECSPVVSVNLPGDAVAGSIGHPLPSVIAALVNEEETNAPGAPYNASCAAAGTTGMLLVRGKSIFSGYLQPESDAERPADPFVEFEGERWYRTGDLVSQDSQGRLFFKGRLKRFVKIGGEMISLPLMESLLQEAFADRDDLPEDGSPFIAVESRPGSEDAGQAEILAFSVLPLNVQQINAVFRDAGMGPVFAVKRVVRVREIPLLGTGKTDYRALQNLV